MRNYRHRTATELDTIREHGGSTPGTHGHPADASRSPHSPVLHSQSRSQSYRQGGVRRRASEVSTVPDTLGPEESNERRYRLRRQKPRWYDPVAKFWTTQVSVTIDEGTHRDHLGGSTRCSALDLARSRAG